MMDRTRIEAFVEKKADYYLDEWETMGYGDKSKASWNWAAFLASPFWMLYRKLYPHLGILIIVYAVDVSVSMYLEDAGMASSRIIVLWDRVSPIIYGSVIGSFANYWYLRRFIKFDELARNSSPDPIHQKEFLRRKGGTNAIVVWTLIVMGVSIGWLMFGETPP